jgi:hypothetical protein
MDHDSRRQLRTLPAATLPNLVLPPLEQLRRRQQQDTRTMYMRNPITYFQDGYNSAYGRRQSS